MCPGTGARPFRSMRRPFLATGAGPLAEPCCASSWRLNWSTAGSGESRRDKTGSVGNIDRGELAADEDGAAVAVVEVVGDRSDLDVEPGVNPRGGGGGVAHRPDVKNRAAAVVVAAGGVRVGHGDAQERSPAGGIQTGGAKVLVGADLVQVISGPIVVVRERADDAGIASAGREQVGP